MSIQTIRTTVVIPTSLMKDTKLILTKKYGNPHGYWNQLINELLEKWVKENKE